MRKSVLLFASVFAAACADNQPAAPRFGAGDASIDRSATDDRGPATLGAVYTLTNQTTNAVRAFRRDPNGALSLIGDFATGGAGTGAGTGSQGALSFARERFLLAVNPGSNEITSFAITPSGLSRVSTIASQGTNPISITSSNDLVYVLNAGGDANVSGFRIDADGRLTAIDGSTRSLGDGATVAAAEVAFDPTGQRIVVTEKGANQLVAFPIGTDGRPGQVAVTPSSGTTPFGFAFSNRGVLVVTEAFGGVPGASATSSYVFGSGSALVARTRSAASGQSAVCWVAVTPNGRYAYAANTGSSTITGYRIGFDGSLALLDANGVTAHTDQTAIDIAVSSDGRFVYNVNSAAHSITGFAIAADGSLTPLGSTTGLPAGDVSIVAR